MNKKILLADDDAIERAALRDLLKTEHGWDITEVDDGQAALDRLCDGYRPDVCLLDIRMPRLDGVQLLQRIRREPTLRDLQVIITSASRDKEIIITLAKLKIAGYLLKPYDADKTRALLHKLLDDNIANPLLSSRNLLVKTALIVDDDAISRTALGDILKEATGWDIIESKDGQEALSRLYSGLRPDLVLADLNMPRLDGYTMVQRMREDMQLNRIRVVITSATQDRDKVKALALLNVSGYLLKPFDATKVKAMLRSALEASAAITEDDEG